MPAQLLNVSLLNWFALLIHVASSYGPENTYWINLQAETNQDPTTPAGTIVCGVYLLGTHLINYEDTEKALMAYNMGPAGALQAWEDGITSTEYTEKVMEAMDRWEAALG